MRSTKPVTALTPIWVVVGLAMGPAVALGFARFAYALLLPPMRAALGWSFANAGAMNTANAAGYLVGALTAAPVGKRLGDRRVFAVSLLLTALTVGVSGLTADFTVLLALRVIAGFTGALAFVCGAGLASAASTGGSINRAPTRWAYISLEPASASRHRLLQFLPCLGGLGGAAAGLSWGFSRSLLPYSAGWLCVVLPNRPTPPRVRHAVVGRRVS